MIYVYCRLNHHTRDLCPECRELFDYANNRIEKCPFKSEKPTCVNCKVHCYRKNEKERIRQVMRFAGPRMLYYHPILAILHLIENRK